MNDNAMYDEIDALAIRVGDKDLADMQTLAVKIGLSIDATLCQRDVDTILHGLLVAKAGVPVAE